MLKLISHVLVFAIGAGVGVYWGVQHPTDAVRVANVEQAKADWVKQQAQSLTHPTPPPSTPVSP